MSAQPAAALEVSPNRGGRNGALLVSGVWLGLLVLAVVLVPWLWFIDDPYALGGEANQGPSRSHWFGTDQLGRDMFARAIWGGRVSLSIAGVSVGIALVIGCLVGVVAGYFRGAIDTLVGSVIYITLALPALMFALFIVTLLGQTFWNVTIAVTILAIPAIARIARAQTLRFAAREFVTVSHMMGARWPRLLFREILPNVIPAMVSIGFLAVGLVIIAEGSLSFIGASVSAPNITWGSIMTAGKGRLEESPHISLITAGMMCATLLALNFIGDELLKRLDVREARI
ncbi:ABC transporter permease [Candidatus Poriferisocius sp.]|uniref:ABC transporter permease n=1 Tax=Candidatus Poriferisocius sp. TaxID=3101276 RepID=UPI003B599EC0